MPQYIIPAVTGIMSLTSTLNNSGGGSIASQQQQLASQLAAQSQPAYQAASQYYTNILNGGADLQKAVGPSVDATNAQFQAAQNNIVNSAYTRGGGLDKALRTLQSGKAMSLSQLYGQAQNQAEQGLAGLAGQGVSASGNILAQAQNSQIQNQTMNNQAFNGIGSLLTRLFSTPNLFGGNKYSGAAGAVQSGTYQVPYVPSPISTTLSPGDGFANSNVKQANPSFSSMNGGTPNYAQVQGF